MKTEKRFRFVFPVLLGVVLMVFTPRVSVGGLADKAKAEAAKISADEETKKLSNTVMKEVDKKIAAAVGKKPISDTDKTNITKKLSGAARQIVKKLIDGAASGELPESTELVNTVMKEVLPQIDGLAAAIVEAERNQSSTAPPPPRPPQIVRQHVVAVYVTGGNDVDAEIKKSVGAGVLNAIVNDKQYKAVENSENFLAEVDSLSNTQIDSAVYDDQISKIGAKFGVRFVYATEITTTSGAFHILVRMIDVQTAEAVSVGSAFSPLKSDDDIAVVSGELVKKIVAGQVVVKVTPKSAHKQVSKQMPSNESGIPAPAPQPQQATDVSAAEGHAAGPLPSIVQKSEPKDDMRASVTGFSLGYGISQDAESNSGLLQFGFVHSRPIFEKFVSVSVNVEGNIWLGMGEYRYKRYDGSGYDYARNSFDFFGANVPVTIWFQRDMFSLETGLFGDAFFVDSEIFYNAGFIIGSGVVFDKKHARWYFYKYNSGYNYGTHMVGMRWLF